MSPLSAPIILAVFVGIILLVVGLILRKGVLIAIGAPAAALLLLWFVIASIPPNPEEEFDRVFGSENRSFATKIATIKPTMMDGHFISFQMPTEEFNARVQPQCQRTHFTNFHLLRRQKLPSGWPQSVADSKSALYNEIGYNQILVYYDSSKETAYASVLYAL